MDYPRLVNAMALVSGSSAAAEDAVQEALARAWELSERGKYIESVPAWVATVARNLLRDRFRRAMAERALASLPPRQREVAVFHYFLDLGVAEIASLLGVPEGTVKSALHRARRSLARAEHDPDLYDVHSTVFLVAGVSLEVVGTEDHRVNGKRLEGSGELCGSRLVRA